MLDLADGMYGLQFASNANWRAQRRFAIHALKDVGYSSPNIVVSRSFNEHGK